MKNKNIETKSIVEAGILIVLIVLATAANLYLPFFEFLGVLIVPLIVSILYIRHDFKVTILAIIASFILIVFIGNVPAAFMFVLMDVLPGIALGYGVKNSKSAFFTIAITAIAYAVGIFLSFYVGNILVSDINMGTLLNDAVNTYNEKMKSIIQQYKQMGISEDKISMIEKNMPKLTMERVLQTFPGYLVVTGMIFSFVNYKIASNILKKINISVSEMRDFTQWHLNDIVAAITIGLMAVGIILNSKQVPGGEYILYSTQIISQFVFTIVGISLVVYLLRNKYRLSKSLIFLIILFTFLLNFASIYFVLGIIDSIINIRKFTNNFK